MWRRIYQTFFAFISIATVFTTNASADDSWPQWRGKFQNGVATGNHFPMRWSQQQGIAWETDLPGLGGSTRSPPTALPT